MLCRGCDGCCVFCLYCEAWCSCMGSVSVSSCRCCMFVSCVHPMAVLNAVFCMTCSLLMLVEDAIGDHTEEAYSRAGLITALYVAMSVSFCLPHPVAVSAFMICRGLCACTEMLWMCVLYVSFGSKVQNPFLTAQSTQIKSVISVPIKDFIHRYPRALFNDIPRVGAHFYDIPGSGHTFTTYPGRGVV